MSKITIELTDSQAHILLTLIGEKAITSIPAHLCSSLNRISGKIWQELRKPSSGGEK